MVVWRDVWGVVCGVWCVDVEGERKDGVEVKSRKTWPDWLQEGG